MRLFSSITMNTLSIKTRDHEALMITNEIGGMTFIQSMLDTGTSINILTTKIFNRHHVGSFNLSLLSFCLGNGSVIPTMGEISREEK